MTENHFRIALSISLFRINTHLFLNFFFTKWLPAAILDDRKSLLIAFLTISDQYATFIFLDFFPQNGCRRPFWMTENPLSIAFLAMAMSNMKLIGEFLTQLEIAQAF